MSKFPVRDKIVTLLKSVTFEDRSELLAEEIIGVFNEANWGEANIAQAERIRDLITECSEQAKVMEEQRALIQEQSQTLLKQQALMELKDKELNELDQAWVGQASEHLEKENAQLLGQIEALKWVIQAQMEIHKHDLPILD